MNIIRAEYFPYKEETEELIAIGIDVHKTLGFGFAEIVYKDALEYEFKKKGIKYEREKQFPIKYKDIVLKRFFKPDFFVNDHLVLEVKARSTILPEDFSQVLNFLKCAGSELGLVWNFGKSSLEIKRMLFK